MKKGVRIEQIEEALDACKRNGLFAQSFMIFGDPEETWDTAVKSINWYRSRIEFDQYFQVFNIMSGLIFAYPGTKLYKDAVKQGKIKDPIRHIKDGGMTPVNLSKLNDDEYHSLMRLFKTIEQPYKVINTKALPTPDKTIDIKYTCPNCDKSILLKGFDELFVNHQRNCTDCGCVCNIIPIECANFANSNSLIDKFIEHENVGVWPVDTINFYWILEIIPCLKSEKSIFINSDSSVKILADKIIYQPDIINQKNISTIIIPNGIDSYNEIKDEIYSRYPSVSKVYHLTELIDC